jgi:hypothetical protein
MATNYLEGYGAGEEKREKTIRWLILAILAVLVIGTVVYFQFRNYSEAKRIDQFLELMRKQDYKAAYAMWGCTDEKPCPDYDMNKFLEDWGPKSPYANAAAAKLTGQRSCEAGVIETLSFPGAEPVYIFVQRAGGVLGFSPWKPEPPENDLLGRVRQLRQQISSDCKALSHQ